MVYWNLWKYVEGKPLIYNGDKFIITKPSLKYFKWHSVIKVTCLSDIGFHSFAKYSQRLLPLILPIIVYWAQIIPDKSSGVHWESWITLLCQWLLVLRLKNLNPGLLMPNAAHLLHNCVLWVQPESRGEGVELSANAKNVCDVAGREFIRVWERKETRSCTQANLLTRHWRQSTPDFQPWLDVITELYLLDEMAPRSISSHLFHLGGSIHMSITFVEKCGSKWGAPITMIYRALLFWWSY